VAEPRDPSGVIIVEVVLQRLDGGKGGQQQLRERQGRQAERQQNARSPRPSRPLLLPDGLGLRRARRTAQEQQQPGLRRLTRLQMPLPILLLRLQLLALPPPPQLIPLYLH